MRYSNYGIVAAHTLPRTGRIFKSLQTAPSIQCYSRASVYSRFTDLSLRDTKCYTIAPRSHRGEYKWTSHVSRAIVLVINDHSRSTHTDTRIAVSTYGRMRGRTDRPTDRPKRQSGACATDVRECARDLYYYEQRRHPRLAGRISARTFKYDIALKLTFRVREETGCECKISDTVVFKKKKNCFIRQ